MELALYQCHIIRDKKSLNLYISKLLTGPKD